MEKRVLVLTVEVDQSKEDKNWIWESHGQNKEINGVLVSSIADKDDTDETDVVTEDPDSDYRAGILLSKLRKAIRYLKEGKLKFAPNTTNSDVDVFLEENSHYLR